MTSKSGSSGHGLSAVLARFINKVQDIRFISISTADGSELLSEAKPGALADDSQLASTLVPSFTVSAEQSSRLNLGTPVNALTWVAGCIVMQTMLESLVLTIVMEESANIGIMEEHLGPLQAILRPFCASFSVDSS